MTRILLADDHALVRAGLRLLLERSGECAVEGEAGNGRAAIDWCKTNSADVAVLDVAMPFLNGMEAAAQILQLQPQMAVVMLSMHSDESYVLRCLRAGARAYVLKESAECELLAAIRAVRAGCSYFSPKVRDLLQSDHISRLRREGREDSFESLTLREREVLQRVAEGASNKDVANVLDLSVLTVETHRKRILEKLGLHGTAELILYAVRRGIVR